MDHRLMVRWAGLMVGVLSVACVAPQAAPPATSSSVARSSAAEPAAAPPAPSVSATRPPEGPRRPTPPRRSGPYAFHQLPTFSKVLFYLRANYVDPRRMDFKRALLAALDSMQRAVPDIQVPPGPPNGRPEVVVRVGAEARSFSLARVDAYWNLRSTLQDICSFIEDHLPPLAPEQEGERMLTLEIAAANGLLQSLDSQSFLFPPATYTALRFGPHLNPSVDRTKARAASGAAFKVLDVSKTPNRPAARVGYLALGGLPLSTNNDVEEALSIFDRSSVNGIIVDLRDNGGGLFEQAVKVADAFVSSGTLVSMIGSTGRKDTAATTSGFEPRVAVAVLVNRNTAAGAEVIVSALQHHTRSVIIGEPTAGAGSVQVFFDVPSPLNPPGGGVARPEMLGLKLTTAEWVGPSGARVPPTGIAPDILLAPAPGRDTALDLARDVLSTARAGGRRELLEASKRLAQERAGQ